MEGKRTYKSFNTSETFWKKMMVYYKWTFSLVFLGLVFVLTMSQLYVPAVCFVVFTAYIFPIALIRTEPNTKADIWKKRIKNWVFFAALAVLVYCAMPLFW